MWNKSKDTARNAEYMAIKTPQFLKYEELGSGCVVFVKSDYTVVHPPSIVNN